MNRELAVFIVIIVLFSGYCTVAAERDVAFPSKADQDLLLDINIGDNLLVVGLAELTLLINNPGGYLEPVTAEDGYRQKVLLEGRVNFFLKGKIKGKYLLTARLDTGETTLEEFLRDLGKPAGGSGIDRFDPDRYYPVYGDESTAVETINNQGNLYIKLAWDGKEFLWGNYPLYLDDNQLLTYRRTLYGWKMAARNSGKDIRVFWSKPTTLHSFDDLRITGGMLYYLKHGNLVPGSEQIQLEVRDKLTGRVLESRLLSNGRDYELDYLSGRLLLKERVSLNYGLFLDAADEEEVFLAADYEYEPLTDAGEQNGYGFNLEIAGISATLLTETTPQGKNYKGVGLSLNKEFSSAIQIALDWANSREALPGRNYSEDGGLSYQEVDFVETTGRADAYHIGIKSKLEEIIPGFQLAVDYKYLDSGFSSQQQVIENQTSSYDLNLSGEKKGLVYSARYYLEEEESVGASSTVALKLEKRASEKLELTGGLKQITERLETGGESEELTGKLGFNYHPDEYRKVFGSYLNSLNGISRSETILGIELKPAEYLSLAMALKVEDAPDSGQVGSLQLEGGYVYKTGELYSNYVVNSQASSSLVMGVKQALSEQADLYVEHKLDSSSFENSKADVLGLKYNLSSFWGFTIDYTRSNVLKNDSTNLLREIISPALVYQRGDLDYQVNLERRRDEGSKGFTQYVLASRLNWLLHEELSLLFNLAYSTNKEKVEEGFIEADIGLAYRPVTQDRLNLLGMYTYQEEYSPEGQADTQAYGERAQIFSLEGIYELTPGWELSEKLSWKKTGEESNTYLWVNRLSYKFTRDWEVYGEYRLLENPQVLDRKGGFLLGVAKKLSDSVKLGLGYNFTDFNDDLTDLDYNQRGLFLNLAKKW